MNSMRLTDMFNNSNEREQESNLMTSGGKMPFKEVEVDNYLIIKGNSDENEGSNKQSHISPSLSTGSKNTPNFDKKDKKSKKKNKVKKRIEDRNSLMESSTSTAGCCSSG